MNLSEHCNFKIFYDLPYLFHNIDIKRSELNNYFTFIFRVVWFGFANSTTHKLETHY